MEHFETYHRYATSKSEVSYHNDLEIQRQLLVRTAVFFRALLQQDVQLRLADARLHTASDGKPRSKTEYEVKYQQILVKLKESQLAADKLRQQVITQKSVLGSKIDTLKAKLEALEKRITSPSRVRPTAPRISPGTLPSRGRTSEHSTFSTSPYLKRISSRPGVKSNISPSRLPLPLTHFTRPRITKPLLSPRNATALSPRGGLSATSTPNGVLSPLSKMLQSRRTSTGSTGKALTSRLMNVTNASVTEINRSASQIMKKKPLFDDLDETFGDTREAEDAVFTNSLQRVDLLLESPEHNNLKRIVRQHSRPSLADKLQKRKLKPLGVADRTIVFHDGDIEDMHEVYRNTPSKAKIPSARDISPVKRDGKTKFKI
ncbi:hypothetical protein BABINDRAFT_160585 [Babjeviella inositovora NRRL Y-12698]|uniref:Uncharacterized protein n=1 Tax=Babjeviella inositovora NRRL Y-12698 TaxID=984486 RepID=A0A1E3QU30_9ASCO|nr:uncharacterized protein BABINDRAFT_160585 [Babjeviella inositovora NRRL Y-12698]ODQ81193.1 hypothetical protein BABINDRAFT_160585 [Babjeviella inositovora NRRL Y-12698]